MTHNQQILALPNPAAGSELVVTPRAGEDWVVLGITATFTASAAVATRNPKLVLDDSTNVGFEINAGFSLIATNVALISWVADQNVSFNTASGAFLTGCFPLRVLPTGWRIRTATTALDAADTYTNISVMFERLDEPPWRNLMIGTPEEQDLEHEISMMQQGG
jgi:hypothetical protein